jgi:predicted Zn-dependent protease
MKRSINYLLLVLSIPIIFAACKKDEGGGSGINIFSIEDDKEMGAQMDAYLQDSLKNQLLDRNQYPEAYNYIDKLKNQILNSGKIKYKEEFEWKVTIIQDDNTLNAFATPGGYIFIYTGLMKYLSCGDYFAGVLGHEMAHSDKRHSTKQMTKQYGTGVLLGALLGDGTISQLTQGLIGLKFSRSDESEADEFSVKYLCAIPNISADGAAGFFQKLIEEGQSGGTPQFLSTHPNPDNRVEAIKAKAKELDCDITPVCSDEYTQVINSLP